MKNWKILVMTFAIGFTCLCSACNESHEKQEKAVAYKIENKEALDNADYKLIINYVGEYAEKAQKYVDDLINGNDVNEAQNNLNNLKNEFSYLDLYRDCIKVTPYSQFDEENQELLKKYEGYMEFTLPLDMTVSTDAVEAGVIVDDTNNIIAPVE